MERKTN